MLRFAVTAFLLLAFASPASSKTHKVTLPNACGDVWAAVKDTLGNAENYTIKITDESRMTVSYAVKHSAHVTVTGALRQRPNTVSLHPDATGCTLEIESNYSGFEHNDAGDFTKRVNESLAKRKDTAPAEAAKTLYITLPDSKPGSTIDSEVNGKRSRLVVQAGNVIRIQSSSAPGKPLRWSLHA